MLIYKEKARALLGKQRHKKQSLPAMDWRDVPVFFTNFSAKQQL